MIARHRRLLAAVLLAAVPLAGCATSRAGSATSVPEEPAAQRRTGCERIAAPADRYEPVKAALYAGGLLGAYLVVRGAAEGAWWGAVTGGGAGNGAWIGAAAGAGVGTIIGVAVGAKKGVEAHQQYRRAYEACMAARVDPDHAK